MDTDSIMKTVQKTGKVLVLQEDSSFGGIAAEISAWISEFAFQYLDAPVKRVCSLDTPIPFASSLEKNYLAKSKLKETLDELLEF